MPNTLRLNGNRRQDIEQAAALLRSGGLVAFPTETVYGLGASAFSIGAVQRIFQAKNRPTWDPLIVHLPSADRLEDVTLMAPETRLRIGQLAESFWPGPLTLLLPRLEQIPTLVTAGRANVGVRVPAHPIAQALLKATNLPIAAPSANRFGHTSPTTAQHVLDDLDGRIDAVLDGGPTQVGLESTVMDPLTTPMVIYRAGAITEEMLFRASGVPAEPYIAEAGKHSGPVSLPSPGVGLRHYAPAATLVLSGPSVQALEDQIERAQRGEGRIGVLLPKDWRLHPSDSLDLQPWGFWEDPGSLGAELFAGLRALEGRGVSTIVCPLPAPGGFRDALRDRLIKAARPL